MKVAGLLALMVLVTSCAGLPAIRPVDAQRTPVCPSPFLTETHRFIHAIEARVAGKTRGSVIGVTVADPAMREISCALVSAEGMALFEAETDGSDLRVFRAMPPFNTLDFARNMIDDVDLIFFPPKGKLIDTGFDSKGLTVCRFALFAGGWLDVIDENEKNVRLRRYGTSGKLNRDVVIHSDARGAYAKIDLVAPGLKGYRLLMDLIEMEALVKIPDRPGGRKVKP